MRDIIFSVVILALLPACFRRPFVGLLVFTWLAYMRAQDLTWGFARGMRWSAYVAFVTFAGFLAGEKSRFFLPDVRCWIMIAMVVIAGIGITMSRSPDPYQISRYAEFTKIICIAIFTTVVVKSREHLRVLCWLIALSFAFYGVKGGLWGIQTLGQSPILRGPGGLLQDNNAFGLALTMAVPFLINIGLSEKREVLRRAFLWAVPLTVFTIALTHSRGSFLSLVGAFGVLIWRSRNRVAAMTVAFLVALVAVIVAPASYKERISTIASYEEDNSAQARFTSWAVAIRMAVDNPWFGVGMKKFRQHYLEYEPNPTPSQLAGTAIYVAHNSYLQAWAEMGSLQMALFFTLIGMTYWTCWKVRKKARRRYYSSWIINYATMFEASLTGYCIGSVFLNRADFDLFYHFVAIVIVFGYIAEQEMRDEHTYPRRSSGGDAPRGAIRRVSKSGFGLKPRLRGFRTAPRAGV